MKLKRAIALLLFAVYIFAAAGSAYASLSCHCVASKTEAAHSCCHHCDIHKSAEGVFLTAPCCNDNHSTDIELYSSNTARDDDNKTLRSAVLDVLPALIAEAQPEITAPSVWEKIVERLILFDEQTHLLGTGLRAPPVLA